MLENILSTDISPELIPGKTNGAVEQKTESVIGPYELQDFNLYYTLRFGFAPTKVAFLAHHAWRSRDAGEWPEGPSVARNQYGLADIRKNLRIFLDRFFRTSQFKRSCIPNAPKVGSGARFRHAATGARRAIRRLPYGSRTSNAFRRKSDVECDPLRSRFTERLAC